MHFYLFILCSMACLMVAAQAAPASLEHIVHRLPDQKTMRPKRNAVRVRRAIPPVITTTASEIVEESVENLARDTRAEEATVAATRKLVSEKGPAQGNQQYFTGPLNAKGKALLSRYQLYEHEARLEQKIKERQMHYADTIHVATHGQKSTKFPMITRFSASVGAVAAVLNVFNTIVAAKTTHAATVPFSTPPTPPTLLDSAGHWDGKSVTLLKPPPTDSKRRRSLVTTTETERKEAAEFPDHTPIFKKRWLLATGAGAAVGALFAPGFWGTITHKGDDAKKPPFDPYNPDMLKQKDPYSVLASSPGQPLPQMNPIPATSFVSPVAALSTVDQLGAKSGTMFVSTSEALPISSNLVPALQRRAESSEELEKRQFANGVGSSLWSQVAMAATAGSVIPLIYGGITHARWRTEHPRDRDIIGDLDDTPTYGAVGVPNRVPGQLASYAMPGYTTYTQQVQAEQLIAQQKLVRDQQQKLADAMKAGVEALPLSTAGSLYSGHATRPVLSKRFLRAEEEPSISRAKLSLVKRGKLLVGGLLTAVGLTLGYLQSATQFPEDREKDKDKKKEEAQKKLMEQQQQQQAPQQQQSSQQVGPMGTGSSMDFGAPALQGLNVGTSDTSSPVYTPMQSSSGLIAGTSLNSVVMPADVIPSTGSSGTISSSFIPAPMTGSPVLSKRSESSASGHEASMKKRMMGMGPKVGRFLEISGLTMFVGTLAANIMVSAKQKSKPVPYVTPNANTKGPVPLGGDLYTQYLQSKSTAPMSPAPPMQDGQKLEIGTPATAPPENSMPVAASAKFSNTGLTTYAPAMGSPVLQRRRHFGTISTLQRPQQNPILTKRLFPGFGLMREATVVAESSVARSAGIDAASKAGTILTSERAAAGGIARTAESGADTGAGTGLGATESTARGMLGAAQPAMLRMPGSAGLSYQPVGRVGVPAAAAVDGRYISAAESGSAGLAENTAKEAVASGEPIEGKAAMAPEAIADKKGLSTMSKVGIVSIAAGVTMLADGAV